MDINDQIDLEPWNNRRRYGPGKKERANYKADKMIRKMMGPATGIKTPDGLSKKGIRAFIDDKNKSKKM